MQINSCIITTPHKEELIFKNVLMEFKVRFKSMISVCFVEKLANMTEASFPITTKNSIIIIMAILN